jgi:ribose transport system permease protein
MMIQKLDRESAGAPATRVRLVDRLGSRLAASNHMALAGVLVILIVGFSIARPSAFPTLANASNVAANAAALVVIAVGETVVIITGGIDLSVGSVLVFAGVVSAQFMIHVDPSPDAGWLVVLAGLVVALVAGLAWGLVNGWLTAALEIPSLVVTLGTLAAALGAAELLTGGVDVKSVPFLLSNTIGLGSVAGIPWLVIIAAVVALVVGVVLAGTLFGQWTYAIGSNSEAARRAGVHIKRHLLGVYALQGLLAGLAGWMYLAYFGTTSISGHATDNLNAIAAVVIGGTSLFGGSGTVLGTVIGVFIPAILLNGFVIMGVQPYWQEIAVGAVLVGAVYIDHRRRRSQSRSGSVIR